MLRYVVDYLNTHSKSVLRQEIKDLRGIIERQNAELLRLYSVDKKRLDDQGRLQAPLEQNIRL